MAMYTINYSGWQGIYPFKLFCNDHSVFVYTIIGLVQIEYLLINKELLPCFRSYFIISSQTTVAIKSEWNE